MADISRKGRSDGDFSPTINDLVFRGCHVSGLRPEVVISFARLVERWTKQSGEEWTVSRLKAIKTDIIRSCAGMPLVSVWIQKRSSQRLGGVIGQMQELALSSSKMMNRVVALVNCYTKFVSKRLTKKQWAKEMDSIPSTEPVYTSYMPGTVVLRVKQETSRPNWLSLPPRKRNPDNWEYRFRPQSSAIYPFLETSRGRYYSLSYRRVAQAISSGMKALGGHTDDIRDVPDVFRAGHILLNQESGYKLRLAAAPNLVLQLATEPLKIMAYRLIREDPSSAVFDQDRGRLMVQKWLREKRTVWSFDLSSATHLFPLELQCQFMTDVGFTDEDINLFAELAREPWLLPDGTELRWSRGQPLGLMPSYGIFHLTHRAMIRQYGVPDDELVLLGDDVAICGQHSAEAYLKLCSDAGLRISPEKTLVSSRVAEFAGSLITEEGIYPQFKWRASTRANALDIVRNLGPAAINVVARNSVERKAIWMIASWPEWQGGFGWNPRGLPLSDRLAPRAWLDYLERDILPRMDGLWRDFDKRIDWSQKGRNIPLFRRAIRFSEQESDDQFRASWPDAIHWDPQLPLPVHHSPFRDSDEYKTDQISSLVSRLKILGLL